MRRKLIGALASLMLLAGLVGEPAQAGGDGTFTYKTPKGETVQLVDTGGDVGIQSTTNHNVYINTKGSNFNVYDYSGNVIDAISSREVLYVLQQMGDGRWQVEFFFWGNPTGWGTGYISNSDYLNYVWSLSSGYAGLSSIPATDSANQNCTGTFKYLALERDTDLYDGNGNWIRTLSVGSWVGVRDNGRNFQSGATHHDWFLIDAYHDYNTGDTAIYDCSSTRTYRFADIVAGSPTPYAYNAELTDSVWN